MNEQDIAIRLTGVKKRYKLGQIGGGTLTARPAELVGACAGKRRPQSAREYGSAPCGADIYGAERR